MLTATSTPGRLFQFVKNWINLRRHRWLIAAFTESQTALGERMYAAGIDDGSLGAKIRALDQQLSWAYSAGDSTQSLMSARHRLILQLAAAALEDDGPLPGAEAEYRRARETQAALETHESALGIRAQHS